MGGYDSASRELAADGAGKRLEEELRASERRFREVLDHSRDLIYRVRLSDLAFEYISPACLDLTGFTQEEIITMGLPAIFDRIHPDDQVHIPAIVHGATGPTIREWTAPNDDFRFRHRDGEYRWFHAVRAQVRDDNGTPVAGVGIIRDVTERHRADEELRGYRDRLEELVLERTAELAETNARFERELAERQRAEESLRESEERFRQLAENVREIFWLSELGNRRVLYISPAFDQVWGRPRGDVYARPDAWLEAIHPDDRAGVARTMEEQADGRVTDYVWRITRPDGGVRWIRNRGFPIRDAAGQFYRVAGIAEDITERMQAEAALRLSEERFRVLCSTAPVGIFLAAADARCLYVNPRLEALCGLKAHECLGYGWLATVHPADQAAVRERIAQVAQTGREFVFEFRLRRPDGGEPWVHVHTTAVHSVGADPLLRVGIVEDMTERRQAEEAARQRQEELAHVARITTVGEMASSLAHELAQPLSAILYFARGCLTQLEHGRWGAAEAGKAMKKIAAQAERASQFIHSLKTFVRKTQPHRVPSDLNAIVRDALAFVMPQVRASRVSIQVDLDETIPRVLADPIQIEHVVLNLVRNGMDALDRAPLGDRKLHLWTCVGSDAAVCFNVHDTGHGLTPHVAAHLYDPFFTTKPEGTGLGLPISRTLIEDVHEGRLWVQPHPERGVVAGFSLPAAQEVGHAEP
jgi:PAS domain S-box-containing protein